MLFRSIDALKEMSRARLQCQHLPLISRSSWLPCQLLRSRFSKNQKLSFNLPVLARLFPRVTKFPHSFLFGFIFVNIKILKNTGYLERLIRFPKWGHVFCRWWGFSKSNHMMIIQKDGLLVLAVMSLVYFDMSWFFTNHDGSRGSVSSIIRWKKQSPSGVCSRWR